jgi:MYXO-CTERM domain-containing protein
MSTTIARRCLAHLPPGGILLALVLAPPATAAAQGARAPYLQSPTETSIVVAWRSTTAQPSAVCWGTSASALTNRAGSGAMGTDHAIAITGLSADTQYFYRAAQASCPPASPGDPLDHFRTAPPRGSARPFRMWIVGDSGTGGTRQGNVRDAMTGALGGRPLDLFLHMGDMAYSSGTTSEFDSRFFGMYASVLRNVPCWPTMGNHEGGSSDSGTESGPYYDAYVLPTNGAAGGMPSGTEAYYAFDWGNVHFVVLDSHDSPREPSGAMLTWLDQDLAANDSTWTIAFFHHPPYTDGTHDSDTEGQLVDMRENANPILEAHGVDLVLAGHSHIYERSYLLRGAYDTPTTAAGHIVDPGDGRLDGDGAYRSGADGTLYVVAGHGGASTGGSASHPVMYFSEVDHGSCLVDVDGDTLTIRNIRWDGIETDHVTLTKASTDGISISRPMPGESYLVGATVPIVWTTTGAAIAFVRVEASVDGGASWSIVADRTENDGMHDWIAPATPSSQARIRVSNADDTSVFDESGLFSITTGSRTVVVPFGSIWQFSDMGTDLGDAWRLGEGGTWTEGAAELGYGDGDEATVIYDTDPNIPTVYFRRRIDVAGEVTSARIRAVFDDGIAVWVNGQLVTQENVGALDFASWATSGLSAEQTFDREIDLTASNPFVVGENWIAAIVKQSSATSSDVSFDLELELGVRVASAVDAGQDVDSGTTGGTDAGGTEPVTGGCGCRTGRASDAPLALFAALALALWARRRQR